MLSHGERVRIDAVHGCVYSKSNNKRSIQATARTNAFCLLHVELPCIHRGHGHDTHAVILLANIRVRQRAIVVFFVVVVIVRAHNLRVPAFVIRF